MFDFLNMIGNYKERKVECYEKDGLLVDTCYVTDSDKPYETAVVHPAYNKGKIVIVELYNTKENAKKGHKKWVKKMTSKKLPRFLKDASTATIATIAYGLSGNKSRIKLKDKSNE